MKEREYIKTGIKGFDDMLKKGIPKGSSILVSGGCGTGKTIFCLQTTYHGLMNNEKCLYLSFEEPKERLREHMVDFGWDPEKFEKSRRLLIEKVRPSEISRISEKMSTGIMEDNVPSSMDGISALVNEFRTPDRVVIDSLSSLSSAFIERPNYRLYIEQLFEFFQKIKATTLLISETEQVPTAFSRIGIEEFLADGVIVLYNIPNRGIIERAIEIRKLRGVEHIRKIVQLQINSGKGITVFPQQPIFHE